MGGEQTLPFTIVRHFFRHLGVPELSDEMTASLIDAVEEDMRRAGALGDDEVVTIQSRKLGEIAKKDPTLANRKQEVMRRRRY